MKPDTFLDAHQRLHVLLAELREAAKRHTRRTPRTGFGYGIASHIRASADILINDINAAVDQIEEAIAVPYYSHGTKLEDASPLEPTIRPMRQLAIDKDARKTVNKQIAEMLASAHQIHGIALNQGDRVSARYAYHLTQKLWEFRAHVWKGQHEENQD